MSYCVHCGVELDDSAEFCALCSTPVVDPNAASDTHAALPYSDVIMLPKSIRKRFVAFLITMIMVIPNLVCLLVSLFFKFETPWAVYLNTSCALVWVVFIMPFLCKKPKSWACLLIDTAATIAYVYAFYYYERGSGWFWMIAVPLILMVALLACIMIEWVKRKHPQWPSIVMAFFAEVGILSLFSELIFRWFYFHSIESISISLIIAVSCMITILFFSTVRNNRKFRAWLTRKFFV